MCICVSVTCESCWEQNGHVLGTGRSSSTSPLLCRSAAVGRRLVMSLCRKIRKWSGHDLDPVFPVGDVGGAMEGTFHAFGVEAILPPPFVA